MKCTNCGKEEKYLTVVKDENGFCSFSCGRTYWDRIHNMIKRLDQEIERKRKQCEEKNTFMCVDGKILFLLQRIKDGEKPTNSAK